MFASENLVFPLNDMLLRKAPNVDNNRFTDHLCISFELCTCENSRGAGYWKLNNTLLQNKTFCKKLQAFIHEETQKLETEDPIRKWEYLKINVKNFCINYSKQLAKYKKKRIEFIELQIKQLELKNSSEMNMNYKRLLEKEIDNYYAEKCSGAYIRSRAVWIEKGEKSSLYFLNLEKSNSQTIQSIR